MVIVRFSLSLLVAPCHLLIIAFANSLYPDQNRSIGYKPFDTLIVFLKEFFAKTYFEKKKSADDIQQNHEKLPSMHRVNYFIFYEATMYLFHICFTGQDLVKRRIHYWLPQNRKKNQTLVAS